MASIIAENVSLVYPLIGADSRFGWKFKRDDARTNSNVGGRIVAERGAKSGVQAISNLNVSLKDGDRLGIFGHNGAGKTTLLRVLAGIYPPTTGTLRIEGRITGLFSLGLGLNKEATGYENITLKALMYGLRRDEIQELIPKVAEFSELGDYLNMPMKTYSSGMTMRLLFSIASALRPEILLLDEWVSSGDRSFKQKVDDRLQSMLETTPIVIIASHNEDRLQGWANRVVTLKKGQVVANVDTSDIENVSNFKPDQDAVAKFKRLVNLGELDGAMSQLEQTWPKAVAPVEFFSQRATLLLKQLNYDEAEVSLRAALDSAPDMPKLHDQMSRVLEKQKRYAQAADSIETALLQSSGLVGKLTRLKKMCDLSDDPDRYSRIVDALYDAK